MSIMFSLPKRIRIIRSISSASLENQAVPNKSLAEVGAACFPSCFQKNLICQSSRAKLAN